MTPERNLDHVLRWMYMWEEAAKRPWATVISMFLSGLVAGGLLDYFRFGDSLAYGIAGGVGMGLVLGTITWRTVRDPARVAALTRRRRESRPVVLRRATVRLALPFVALGIATAAGAAAHSLGVFEITLVVGLVAAFLLSRFLTF